MLRTCLKLCEYIALGLGKDRFFFHPWFEKDTMSTYRAIHILPRATGVVDSSKLDENERKLTTPEHSDSGFLTILSTLMYPGLQVEIDKEYRSIKPQKNMLVVNLGDTFARITNFKLKATKHRVLDIGIERFSSPFFFEPKYTAVIRANILADSEEKSEEDVVFGDWLSSRILEYIEWKGFELPPPYIHRTTVKQVWVREINYW